MIDLICTHDAKNFCNSGLFTEGNKYRATLGPNESTFHIKDDLGHERVILKDSLRFCVCNRGPNGPLDYAHFEIIGEESEND